MQVTMDNPAAKLVYKRPKHVKSSRLYVRGRRGQEFVWSGKAESVAVAAADDERWICVQVCRRIRRESRDCNDFGTADWMTHLLRRAGIEKKRTRASK